MGFWDALLNGTKAEKAEISRRNNQDWADRRRREETRQAESQKQSTGSYWPYDPPGESGMH